MQTVDQETAALVALNLPLVAQRLELGASPPGGDAASGLTAELAALGDGAGAVLLEELATALLAGNAEVAAVVADARERAEVRTAGPEEAVVLLEVWRMLKEDPALFGYLVLLVRMLGTNKVKVGKVEIETASVLKDLADIARRPPRDGSA